ncbi:sodium:solute symporter family protein [Pseudonocardia hierapolitana]|uniref:Sodium:solute symporter family protein n=1 Tax=Pseudonocardia hierapolitana TaxID=1128676 RepID=A0A561SJ87_9PSEU|nr:sodium:solute symporter family protein [Pseudonocardia hierapolitana]
MAARSVTPRRGPSDLLPFYYGSKARSVLEFLRRRFNTTTQRVNAVTFALAAVLIAGVNLYALGLILEALLGWSLELAIPIAALVVLSYTFLGGLSAAIYNEVLQFFVILALLIPLTVACLARVGSWEGLRDAVSGLPPGPEQLSSWPGTPLTEIASPFLSVLGIVFVLSFGVLDHQLRGGATYAVGAQHVGGAPQTDHRRVLQGVDPAGRGDPRHGRRRPGAAADHVEGGWS